MTDMLTRFLESKKPRPAEAQQIPNLAVNFFDQNNEFQDGFVTGEKQGDPTKFTAKAQDYYDTEVTQILIPAGFQPTEEGITLHRYGPTQKYYNPGQGKP